MSDQYAHVVKSSLKLKSKGALDGGIKKKKKPKTSTASTEQGASADTQARGDALSRKPASETAPRAGVTKTKAELKFQEMQEKRQMDRILKKAGKTHKQQVEDFNKHLDSLSEHYDIPKVSWTK